MGREPLSDHQAVHPLHQALDRVAGGGEGDNGHAVGAGVRRGDVDAAGARVHRDTDRRPAGRDPSQR